MSVVTLSEECPRLRRRSEARGEKEYPARVAARAAGHAEPKGVRMVRLGRLLLLATVAATCLVFATGGSAASKATYYVSVGDSLAQGYQPIGGPPSPLGVDGYAQGYANQLFKAVRDRPHRPDIHANSDGYAVIAEAFEAQL
jgi:hypothetical protein